MDKIEEFLLDLGSLWSIIKSQQSIDVFLRMRFDETRNPWLHAFLNLIEGKKSLVIFFKFSAFESSDV